MNLNILAGGVLNGCGVHKYQTAEIYFYEDFQNINGVPIPSYSAPVSIKIQMYNLPTGVLKHNNAYNEAAFNKVLYLNLGVTTVSRINKNGGDMVKVGSDWYLVTDYRDDFIEEGWISAIVTLQVEPPQGLS